MIVYGYAVIGELDLARTIAAVGSGAMLELALWSAGPALCASDIIRNVEDRFRRRLHSLRDASNPPGPRKTRKTAGAARNAVSSAAPAGPVQNL